MHKIHLKLKLMSLLTVAAMNAAAPAAEYHVATEADIARLTGKLQPGDVLVLADGTWKDQVIILRGSGTAEQPITLRAQTPGQVVLTGKSSVTMDGEHLVVSGLCLKNGEGAKEGVAIKGAHCRLTETAIIGGTYKFFVRLWGSENRVDHCYLAGKTSESPTLQIEVEDKPNHHQIDHNHFGPRPPLGKNGGETIRVGYSDQSMRNSGTLVEHNLFDRCDGEIEIISNKSCENIYRGNTFLDCAGMLTLRHGNRCRVEGNFLFGHGKKGSGGIRIIGEDHTIINNYVDGVARGGFWLTAGVPDSPLNGYFRARNVVLAFNTVVNSRGPSIDLDNGFGNSRRSLRPENITITNNLFALASDGTLLQGTEGEGFHWLGNMATAPATTGHKGIRIVDPKLAQSQDGLWRPAADSPVRGAAEGDCAAITTDIDGQPRTGRWDVGCDQVSAGSVLHRPLTGADVGPAWMPASTRP
ncbi:MAG: polysaccharide lyase 6 family protein [Armatimonadota bacterium]|nr:polysaccharide lyase 6 family protein [Armatimonadota bacterium]